MPSLSMPIFPTIILPFISAIRRNIATEGRNSFGSVATMHTRRATFSSPMGNSRPMTIEASPLISTGIR